MLKINRMNNNNEANETNDNGEELDVGLPEMERQELQRLRREVQQEIQQEIIRLRQENAWLRAERQRELELLEQRRLLQQQVEQRQYFLDEANARMVRVARRRELPQRQAFATHVLERQQQQQAESVEEDAEEDTDAVSSSMVEPNP